MLYNIFNVLKPFSILKYIFSLQFDEPTEDLPEFVAEEEAGFKG